MTFRICECFKFQTEYGYHEPTRTAFPMEAIYEWSTKDGSVKKPREETHLYVDPPFFMGDSYRLDLVCRRSFRITKSAFSLFYGIDLPYNLPINILYASENTMLRNRYW